MMSKLLLTLILLSALGCGLIGGVFFAFSTFVMRALAALPSPQGIAAMKSINTAVLNPMFLGVFLGTAVGCVILIVPALLNWQGPGSACMLVGSASYLLGTFLVTAVFNVPRNDALATLDPASAESARLWAEYVTSWTLWNHVRTIAAIAAAILLMIAMVLVRARADLNSKRAGDELDHAWSTSDEEEYKRANQLQSRCRSNGRTSD
jgi:uncharacterized membrane protein